jgi:hypothetical protein
MNHFGGIEQIADVAQLVERLNGINAGAILSNCPDVI